MFAAPLRFLGRVMRKRCARSADADALLLSEQRFHAIWEAAADAMALSNADGIVLAANPAYYQRYFAIGRAKCV
jgi:PAS domain-containing protein